VQAVVRLEEALPPEHPVHVFVDLVQGVDLSPFVIPPGSKGEKPYHPHALFAILAWGYLHGVRSSRKLARLARQEATFVYLASDFAHARFIQNARSNSTLPELRRAISSPSIAQMR
jgi:transposase